MLPTLAPKLQQPLGDSSFPFPSAQLLSIHFFRDTVQEFTVYAQEPQSALSRFGDQAGSAEYQTSTLNDVSTPTFADVPYDHPYHDHIEALYQAGYTAGCSTEPLLYCPEDIMTRAESAVFVERGIHGAAYDPPDPTQAIFADVALEAWYADWVHGLWNDGYTSGCETNPLRYCPERDHTRAEGTVFYLRIMYGADYEPPSSDESVFADVDPAAWYHNWVNAAHDPAVQSRSCDSAQMNP